jgi:alanyl-tRNA synthetase
MTSPTPIPFGHPHAWPAAKVRQTFIEFFESKPKSGPAKTLASAPGHAFVPSSPCVPVDDPTLLFTNAGMNQFKPLFLGRAEPGSPLFGLKRAVNSQKCIRAGGKHNDLDDVGKDTYHHTLFEMLGNWSFGDYFKQEAVDWSWELLTKVYGIPADRLYATYFGGYAAAGLDPDEETRQLWLKYLPESHVLPGNMKDNFWEMGETGPCGPCTEIHFDRIGGRNAAAMVNGGDPDVLEIWNNVFIQFNREDGGQLKVLPAKHVDTGMGLERLVSVMQNKRSNYDTDVFMPIFAAIERVTAAPHAYAGRLGAADVGNVDTAYRVIADHIRTLTFAITDGAVPSNEGRGYVLRRILRRAVRFGRQVLGARSGFFSQLVPTVVEHFGAFFPELTKNPQRVIDIIREEEESFGKTLDRGIKLFDETAKKHGGIPAEDAFKLHDTFGFPVDLTAQMAEERGLRVDVAGYERLMEEAKDKARAGSGGRFSSASGAMVLQPDTLAKLENLGVRPTADVDKYHGHAVSAHVRAIWNGTDFDQRVRAGDLSVDAVIGVVLDQTNFFAEMGGQQADNGRLVVIAESKTHRHDKHDGGEFRVEEVKSFGPYVLHIGRVVRGEIAIGDSVQCSLDSQRRASISGNHTATHLLNHALRAVVGPGADQKGSLVAADKLRFDFVQNGSISAEDLAKIEAHVQHAIDTDLTVYAETAPLFVAKQVSGLRAVFGESYPDPVRVVSIGVPVQELLDSPGSAAWNEASIEFCGGIHVESTRAIHAFALISEEPVAKGVRRITGVTGVPALAARQAAEGVSAKLSAAAMLSGPALEAAASEVNVQLESLTLPAPQRAELRARLALLQDRLKEAEKLAGAARAGEAAKIARSLGESALASNTLVIVNSIDVGSDRKALQSALNTIQQICPRSAIMLFAEDKVEGKVALVAAVPPDLVKRGLSAGDWVRSTSELLGGKGGGKPDSAQGGGTDVGKIKEALMHASHFATGKVH